MRLNPIAWWRRRHDENDVQPHPDAGRLGSPVRHRAPVRGARVALKAIDAELATTPGPQSAAGMTEFYATQHQYLESTVPGLRKHAERCLTRATDAENKIRDLMSEISDLTELAARERQEADDHYRVAALVELDALPSIGAAWPQVPLGGEPVDRGGEVLDERMQGMGAPAADESTAPLPWPWQPGPADVPGSRDGDTHTMPVYDAAGGAR